jgi:hypothetical protein
MDLYFLYKFHTLFGGWSYVYEYANVSVRALIGSHIRPSLVTQNGGMLDSFIESLQFSSA